jgi:hypothetical protein
MTQEESAARQLRMIGELYPELYVELPDYPSGMASGLYVLPNLLNYIAHSLDGKFSNAVKGAIYDSNVT